MVPVGETAAAISVLLWVIAGTIAKKISVDLGSRLVSFIYVTFSILPIAIATAVVGAYSVTLYSVVLSLLAGLFLSVGFIYNFKALQLESLSSVAVIGELTPALLVMFGIFVLGESVTGVEALGILIVFSGTLMLVTTEKLRVNRKLVPAVVSVICWTAYWIIISYAITSSGTFTMPILMSRLVGIPAVAIYLGSDRASTLKLRGLWRRLKTDRVLAAIISLVLIASVSDGIGDVVFGITVGSPVLAIGATLVALQPMILSFAGFVLYRDRLTRLQIAGLIIMVAGALVLSVL